MYRNAAGAKCKIAGIVSAVILILAAAVPAAAQTSNNRSVTLAERQLLLIERMTNSALLAALGIDASPSLNAIHWSRNRFDGMQRDLRQGDPNVGLEATTEPKILEKLDLANLRWQRYDEIFGEIVKSKKASKAQIGALTASHKDTVQALGQMVDSYEYFIFGGQHHSILSSTINGTGQLRASTQLVLRCLMTTAYNEYAASDREQLTQATKDFDRTMNGLLRGDEERRLLPAATREIKTELMKVFEMWKEIRPILQAASVGEAVTKKQIATVAKAANDMAVPLTLVLIMYLSV